MTFMADYWVIVTDATSDKPTCYILKPGEIEAFKGDKDGKVSYWLQPKVYAD